MYLARPWPVLQNVLYGLVAWLLVAEGLPGPGDVDKDLVHEAVALAQDHAV